MKRWFAWAFWSVVYLFRRQPTDLDRYLLRITRTSLPWWRWKPNVFRNEDGRMWEVQLTNEATYSERRTLTIDVKVSMETGRIVGLDLWDELLKDGRR